MIFLHRGFKVFVCFAFASFLLVGLARSGFAGEWEKVVEGKKGGEDRRLHSGKCQVEKGNGEGFREALCWD